MTITKYLVISATKSRYGGLVGKVRMVERVPTLKGNEVSLRLSLELPNAMFERPQLEAKMEVPEEAVPEITITPEVTENIQKIIKETIGLNMVVSVIEQPKEEGEQEEGQLTL